MEQQIHGSLSLFPPENGEAVGPLTLPAPLHRLTLSPRPQGDQQQTRMDHTQHRPCSLLAMSSGTPRLKLGASTCLPQS